MQDWARPLGVSPEKGSGRDKLAGWAHHCSTSTCPSSGPRPQSTVIPCAPPLSSRSTSMEWMRQDTYSTSSATQSCAASSWCWEEKESGKGGEDWRAGPATWTRCMDSAGQAQHTAHPGATGSLEGLLSSHRHILGCCRSAAK